MLDRSAYSGPRRDKRERMNVTLPFCFARKNDPDKLASLIIIGQNVQVEIQRPTNYRARQCIWKHKSPRDLTVDRRTIEN